MQKNIKIITILILITSALWADVPQLVNYQAFLTSNEGEALNETVQITFAIYSTQNGTESQWQETQLVTVESGFFHVLLGSVEPIPYYVFDGNTKYLSIKVKDDDEMLPRKPIVSTGYSFMSANSAKLGGNSSDEFVKKDEAESISTNMIQNNSIDQSKLNVPVVSSINNVKNSGGNIQLVPGSNVNIFSDDSTNQIIISASSSGGGGGGEITSVNAGGGLAGGGDFGDVTIHVGQGTGIKVNTNSVEIDTAFLYHNLLKNKNNIITSLLIKDGEVKSSDVANNSLTAQDLNVDVVSSINNVKNDGGNISLVAGSNITITPNDTDNQITISASSNGGSVEGNTLDQAYDQGGAGAGRIITADSGPVTINGDDGFYVNEQVGIGISPQSAMLTIQNSSSANYARALDIWTPNTNTEEHGALINFGTGEGDFNSGHLSFKPSDTEGDEHIEIGFWGANDKVIITRDGRVGINKTNPMHNLDVAGQIHAESAISAGGGFQVNSTYASGATLSSYWEEGLTASSSKANGVEGISNDRYGIYGMSSTDFSGYFDGDVVVTGTLQEGVGMMKIDHPSDPERKYLIHHTINSDQMTNIYNGNVILDSNGKSIVNLPEWFDDLNKNIRYQLTPIGGAAPNLHILSEVKNNSFEIAGGSAGLKVSWQVTGERKDAYANFHKGPIEQDKPIEKSGKYMHPLEHNMPLEMDENYEQKSAAKTKLNNISNQ